MMTGTNPIEQKDNITSVWYGGDMIAVRILDRFESGGIDLAVVEAVENHPFVGGDKWPVATPWTTVKLSEIYEISPIGA